MGALVAEFGWGGVDHLSELPEEKRLQHARIGGFRPLVAELIIRVFSLAA